MFKESGKYISRLTGVIDCGTHKGYRKVFLSFQMEDFTLTPQNTSLPPYKQFTKFPYGGTLELSETSRDSGKLNGILDVLGYDGGDKLDFLISKVGSIVKLNIRADEYRGKLLPVVSDDGHEQVLDHPPVDWGVDLKTFKFTENTTMEEINSLGFDKKHVKGSEEYTTVFNSANIEDISF